MTNAPTCAVCNRDDGGGMYVNGYWLCSRCNMRQVFTQMSVDDMIAQYNDPAWLRQRVRELEREMADLAAGTVAPTDSWCFKSFVSDEPEKEAE